MALIKTWLSLSLRPPWLEKYRAHPTPSYFLAIGCQITYIYDLSFQFAKV